MVEQDPGRHVAGQDIRGRPRPVICQAPTAPAAGLSAEFPDPRFWGLPVWNQPRILGPVLIRTFGALGSVKTPEPGRTTLVRLRLVIPRAHRSSVAGGRQAGALAMSQPADPARLCRARPSQRVVPWD